MLSGVGCWGRRVGLAPCACNRVTRTQAVNGAGLLVGTTVAAVTWRRKGRARGGRGAGEGAGRVWNLPAFAQAL